MNKTTYYQRNREVILNRTKDYSRNNRDELKVKARDKYRELSEEEKNVTKEIIVSLDKQHNFLIKINKNTFHKKTTSINIDEVESDKITLLHKTSYGNKGSFKYHIGYRHKNEALISPLNMKLPQLTGYTKHFDNNNKYVNLLVNDKTLLKKYNEIWDKIKILSKRELDKKPLYNNKYISSKIKIYNDTIHTEFKYIEPKDRDC